MSGDYAGLFSRAFDDLTVYKIYKTSIYFPRSVYSNFFIKESINFVQHGYFSPIRL
jgi:hypothetical protein